MDEQARASTSAGIQTQYVLWHHGPLALTGQKNMVYSSESAANAAARELRLAVPVAIFRILDGFQSLVPMAFMPAAFVSKVDAATPPDRTPANSILELYLRGWRLQQVTLQHDQTKHETRLFVQATTDNGHLAGREECFLLDGKNEHQQAAVPLYIHIWAKRDQPRSAQRVRISDGIYRSDPLLFQHL